MSLLRHRFRVVVDGKPHNVTTSARDMANSQVEEGDLRDGGVWTTFRLVHAAMLRLDLPVPTDLDTFVDLLDEVTDLDESDAEAEPDPTRAVV